MIYELALISVVIGAGYWGAFFVRQKPHGTATFGLMQLAAAALAGLGLVGRKVDEDWLGVAGAVGVGAGACLLVVGPLARVLARRLVAAERPALAARLFDLAELLAPGSGVAEERALVRAMTEVREGRIDSTVDALTAARHRAPADAQLAIDERIAMLYVAAYRWSDAIRYAESHLFGAAPPDDGGSLRRALGVAPPVWVELLGAYGRVGDLDQAARMVARLEDVCAGRDDAAVWIHRARVMFLALAGRIEAVRALVARRQARHMSTAARTYWIAVAHEHHGDRAEAALAYEKARARSRGRPRELIDTALAGLAARTQPGPTELAPAAHDVVARIEAAPLPPPIRVLRTRGARATWAITGALIAVSALGALAFGDTADVGVLLRIGALVRGVVASGEWWRLIACVFVHVGVMHLVLNVAGLLVIGRFAEELFGGARLVAIFAVSGLAGSLASYLAAPAGISAGASGAVFGLLGAALVEIAVHRRRYRAVWKQGMWGGLLVVTVSQLGFGFFYPMIDQWAHGAGLIAGMVMGLALSPHLRWARLTGHAAAAIAVGFAAATLVAFGLVATTSMADSLARGALVRRVVEGVAVDAPAGWRVAGNELGQPDKLVTVRLERFPRTDSPHQILLQNLDAVRRNTAELGELTPAHARLIALPAGWEGFELEATPADEMGYGQRVRMLVCGRGFGNEVIVTSIQIPETIARAAPEVVARLLASIGPA